MRMVGCVLKHAAIRCVRICQYKIIAPVFGIEMSRQHVAAATGFVAVANNNRKGKSMPSFNIRSRANSRSLSIAGRANTQWRICVGRILLLGIGLGIAHPSRTMRMPMYEAQENSIVGLSQKPACCREKAVLLQCDGAADYWETLKTYALRRKLPPEARTLERPKICFD